MSAVKTAACGDGARTIWLKYDRKSLWFNALKQVSTSLVVDFAKLLVDGKAAAQTAARDTSAQFHLGKQVCKELARPKVKNLLQIH